MQIPLLLAAIALALLSIAQAADKSAGEPPAQFLRTDNPAWQRVLATKITADFRDAPMREVIDYLKGAGQMNTVMKLDVEPAQAVGDRKKLPKAAPDIPGAPVETEIPGATGAPRNELKDYAKV